MIKIKNLFFSYEKNPVLKDISCHINTGDFMAIIGPNGAGKSTLLKCISGFLTPKSGTILINKKQQKRYKKEDLAKKVAVVVQQPHFEFDFTVREIVLMGRFPYLNFLGNYRKIDFQQTEQTLKNLKIEHLKSRKLSSLSGGEFQLVMIARALNQQTDVLFFDEPASHLDIHHQIKIFSLLKKLNSQQNKTIMAVSHNLNLAAEYCDKILLISEGKLIESGPVMEVLESPNLERVFQTKLQIEQNPFTQNPSVIYDYSGENNE